MWLPKWRKNKRLSGEAAKNSAATINGLKSCIIGYVQPKLQGGKTADNIRREYDARFKAATKAELSQALRQVIDENVESTLMHVCLYPDSLFVKLTGKSNRFPLHFFKKVNFWDELSRKTSDLTLDSVDQLKKPYLYNWLLLQKTMQNSPVKRPTIFKRLVLRRTAETVYVRKYAKELSREDRQVEFGLFSLFLFRCPEYRRSLLAPLGKYNRTVLLGVERQWVRNQLASLAEKRKRGRKEKKGKGRKERGQGQARKKEQAQEQERGQEQAREKEQAQKKVQEQGQWQGQEKGNGGKHRRKVEGMARVGGEQVDWIDMVGRSIADANFSKDQRIIQRRNSDKKKQQIALPQVRQHVSVSATDLFLLLADRRYVKSKRKELPAVIQSIGASELVKSFPGHFPVSIEAGEECQIVLRKRGTVGLSSQPTLGTVEGLDSFEISKQDLALIAKIRSGYSKMRSDINRKKAISGIKLGDEMPAFEITFHLNELLLNFADCHGKQYGASENVFDSQGVLITSFKKLMQFTNVRYDQLTAQLREDLAGGNIQIDYSLETFVQQCLAVNREQETNGQYAEYFDPIYSLFVLLVLAHFKMGAPGREGTQLLGDIGANLALNLRNASKLESPGVDQESVLQKDDEADKSLVPENPADISVFSEASIFLSGTGLSGSGSSFFGDESSIALSRDGENKSFVGQEANLLSTPAVRGDCYADGSRDLSFYSPERKEYSSVGSSFDTEESIRIDDYGSEKRL